MYTTVGKELFAIASIVDFLELSKGLLPFLLITVLVMFSLGIFPNQRMSCRHGYDF